MIASEDNLNQAGAFLEYGMAEEEIPLPYRNNHDRLKMLVKMNLMR